MDEWVDVSEGEIARGMRHCVEVEHMLIEGAAAVALAVALERLATLRGRVVVVLCGANVSAERLKAVL